MASSQPVSWEQALDARRHEAARKFATRAAASAIGVIGSNRTTNEENYLLQKFARTVLGTNNIDHHRTADYVAFARALSGQRRTRCFAARYRDRAGNPAARQRSHRAASRAGLEPSHQRPPQPRAALRRQPRRDQAAPPGQGRRSHSRRTATPTLVRLPRPANDADLRRQSTTRPAFRDALLAEKNAAHRLRLGVSRARHRRARRTSACRCPMRGSPASATTPTRAARPTWACCPICCPATSPSPNRGRLRRRVRQRLAAHARPGSGRDVRRRRARRSGARSTSSAQTPSRATASIPPRSRTPSSSCRICSSPRPRAGRRGLARRQSL